MSRTDLKADDTTQLVDLMAMASMVWRGKHVIILCALAAMLLGGWYSFVVAVPKYGADAQVVLETRDEQVLDIESVLGGISASEEGLQTETHILSGRRLMGLVVDDLNLIDDPEFNLALRSEEFSPVSVLKSELKKLISIFRPADSAPEFPSSLTNDLERDNVVNTLRSKVTVRNIPGTYILSIWVVTENAEKSVRIANAIGEIYIQDQLSTKFSATTQATEWLAQQVLTVENELNSAERFLTSLRDQNDFVSEEKVTSFENRISALRRTLVERQSNLEEKLTNLDRLRTATSEAARRNVAMSLGYAAYLGGNTDLDDSWQQITRRAERDVVDAQSQVNSITSSIEQLEQDLNAQSIGLSALQQATNDVSAKRLLFESLQNRLRETSIQEGLQRPDSRVIERAVLLPDPISPRKLRAVSVAMVMGGILGCSIVLFMQILRPKVISAARLSHISGIPVLASLPKFPFNIRNQMLPIPSAFTREGEAIRNLRSSLMMMTERSDSDQSAVILITSSRSGNGKSTTALALAESYSKLGKKVLLIDTDTRLQTISVRLSMKAKRGFVDVLLGDCELSDVVHPSDIQGVTLLPAGISNNLDVFDLLSVDALFTEARRIWDVIILDTAPLMVVSDALKLFKQADMKILLAEYNSSTEKEILQCQDRLLQLGEKPDALVITKSRNYSDMLGWGRNANRYYSSTL